MWEFVTRANGNLRSMARRIEHQAGSPWDALTVYTTLIDPTFLTRRLEVLGGDHAELAEHHQSGDRVRYRLRQGVPAESLPPALRALLGGNLMVDRTETWQPDVTGGYSGTVRVTIEAVPGELGGTVRLIESSTGGSERTVNGSVTIPIPLIGGKIEESVVERIRQLLDDEDKFVQDWLAQRHR